MCNASVFTYHDVTVFVNFARAAREASCTSFIFMLLIGLSPVQSEAYILFFSLI